MFIHEIVAIAEGKSLGFVLRELGIPAKLIFSAC